METIKVIKGYELRERIGSGGFGIVHRAYQSTLGREVAIKIILPHFANHPDFIRRFESEAQLIARLEHPHIVPLYDYWRDLEGAFLVMRWLRGGSLREALQQDSFELEAAALLLDQVTSALALAHRNGVIHRDLKPENILLDEDSNAYLSDFGIAKDVRDIQGSQTAADVILGSPDYLSPEQARSEPVTPQTDIYSLGVMLYEMLTGQHPFPGKTSVERIYKHLNDPLPDITTLPEDMSEGVNAIIQKATAKNPAQRYGDVLEVAAAFRDEIALSRTQVGASLVEQLTLREQEILQLIIEGCSNREIADRLFVTPGTVKWYIWQLYRKLRVRSRVQAIVRARELNLVVPAISANVDVAEATYVPLPEPENPYKGLRAFQAADARDFFGREKLTQKLVTRLKEKNPFSRFLAVVGPSGSGKSSVVKAGVVPALWRGDLPGSDRWFVVEIVPGARPLDELEVALTRIAANQTGNLREHLNRDPYGLLRVAGLILPDDGSDLVLIVDQFEEVFTLVEDEDVRVQFLNLIQAAVTDPHSRVRVIVTLRADFYDRPLQYPEFGELVRSRMETVLPLAASELEAAIARPAERVGVSFEPGLVATITSDVHYQPGALPLIQYALTELFEQRTDRTLTRAAYQSLGGAVGTLAKRADDIYNEQDERGRDAVRQMFLRLVTVGEDAEDTRRRVSRAELLAVAADTDAMDEVIDTYAAYRLLTLDHEPSTRRPTVEIAHEAILREWQRLRVWLNESRHDIRQQRLLATAAAEWQQAYCDTSYLLAGGRLEQFAGWAAETKLALTQQERDFLETSLTEHERQETDERERQARELALQKRSANRLRYLVAGLTVFLAVAIGLAAVAFAARSTAQHQRDKAEREAEVNRSLVLANEAVQRYNGGKPDLALALALEAVKIDEPPAEAVRALSTVALGMGTRAILRDQGNKVTALAFNANSTRALSGNCETLVEDICTESELIVWDIGAATELRRLQGQTGWITNVAFDPTQPEYALSASEDGTLFLWNIETAEMVRRFEGHTGSVNSVVFSADGTTALSGSDDQTVILWDVATGQIIRRYEGHTAGVTTVIFSPDGQLIAAGGDGDDATILLWQLDTGAVAHKLVGPTARIVSMNFRRNEQGKTLVLALSFDNTYREWDVETDTLTRSLVVGDATAGLTLTPDGQNALSCTGSNTCYLMDISSWRQLSMIFTPSLRMVSSNTISPNGELALIGSEVGEAILVNLPISNEAHRFYTEGGIASVDASPDGRYLLTGSYNTGTAILWDVQTGQEVRRYEGLEPQVSHISFSPNGRQALLCSSDAYSGSPATKVVLWDIETGNVIHEWTEFEFYPRRAAFSPDGRTALIGTMQWGDAWEEQGGGELVLLDLVTGQEIRRFENTMATLDISFSPDGRWAVTANTFQGVVTLWDVGTGKVVHQYDHTSAAVSFTADPRYFLAGSSGGFVFLIDVESGEIIRSFSAPAPYYWSIDIDSEQQRVIGGTGNGQIYLWNFKTGEEIQHFRVLSSSSDVWDVVFSPDGHMAFSSTLAGEAEAIEWRIADWPLDKLLAWIHENRYIRDLTCDERTQYRIEPLC